MTVWPLHDLSLHTPDLHLRGTTEADALALAAVVPDDVAHDPALPDVSPAHKVLLKYWQSAGSLGPGEWNLWFTVLHGDALVGVQGLKAKDFPTLRTVGSWSWLLPAARGKGWGKQMRAAVLSLSFEHLRAARAVTEAWVDNEASLGVSRSLGYADNGVDRVLRLPGDGVEVETPSDMQRLVLEREAWQSPYPVTVAGAAAVLPLLGLS